MQRENELRPRKPKDLSVLMDIETVGKECLDYVWDKMKKKKNKPEIQGEDTPVVR